MNGFLGTNASLLSDITLIAYLFLLLPGMLLGFAFARRKMYEPHHKLVMTSVVIVNWVLIAVVMLGSYQRGVAPYLSSAFGDVRVSLPTLHAITGGLGQLLATYLAIRMWFEKQLPAALKVKNIKFYMRTTLALWVVTILLGAVIYLTWYSAPARISDDTPPAATAEAVNPAATAEAVNPAATAEAVNPAATAEAVSPAATPEAVGG